jgi:hypothetical protein
METPFIRNDLDQTTVGAGTAWYRLDAQLRDFLNKCEEKHEIEAVVLSRKDDGSVDWNIGFVIKGK